MFNEEKDYLMSLKKEDSYHFSIPFEYIEKNYGDDNYDIAETNMEVDVVWNDADMGYEISHYVPEMYLIDPEEGNSDEIEFYDSQVLPIIEQKLDLLGITCEAVKDWGGLW